MWIHNLFAEYFMFKYVGMEQHLPVHHNAKQ